MSKAQKTDDLANSLADSLNKKFKSFKVAYFLDGSEETPTDLEEWISTGSSILDLAISNRKNGGLPVGRITELTGLEASGKSLLAAHLLANTQKKDGLAVYIDTENAMNEEFAKCIGIDVSKMLYIQLETVEDIFEVGAEVRNQFSAASESAESLTAIHAAFTPSKNAGKFMADIYALAVIRLKTLGIRAISGAGLCTFCEPERFYSFRREAESGRLLSLIFIK